MLSVIALVATASAAPATVQSGVERWRAGDYPAAVAAWLPFAAQGDADALFNMGQAYKLGRGVTKDPAIARDYYRKAATRGHLPAQANLGIALFQAGDKAEAVRWLKTAADRGEPRAQYVYGIAAYNGDGTPKNQGLAYGYLLRAKASGLAQATTALGSIEPMLTPDARAAGVQMAASMASGAGVPASVAAASAKPGIAATIARKFDELKVPFTATVPAPAAIVTARPALSPPVNIAAASKPATTPPAVIARATPTVAPPTVIARPAPVVPQPTQIAIGTIPPEPTPIAVAPPPVVAAPVDTPKPAVVAATPLPKPPVVVAAKPVVEPKATKPKAVETKVADAAKPSGWRVQLGAFSSKKLADEAWLSVKSKQGSSIGKAKPIFDTSGAMVKFQIGPYGDRTEARDVCAKLAFAGRACFVTQG